MAKRTTSKASTKGSTSKTTRKRRATPAASKAKKKPALKGTRKSAVASSGKKRRTATATKASSATAKKLSAKKRSTRATAVRSKTARPKAAEIAPPDATSQDPIQFPEQKRLPKTRLGVKKLREFRELLLAKRAELLSNVQGLADEALYRDGRSQGDRSAMPIHMADLGTDNWEQEFTLGLLASEQAIVREIDEALARIEDKTYGVCLVTHNQISEDRLRVKPWAKYCIEYARAREQGRAL